MGEGTVAFRGTGADPIAGSVKPDISLCDFLRAKDSDPSELQERRSDSPSHSRPSRGTSHPLMQRFLLL